MISINASSYEQFVQQSDGLSIIHFHAEWCPPCKRMLPLLESLEKQYQSVQFASLDVDKNAELLQSIGLNAIPAVIFVKKGKVLERRIGIQSKAEITSVIGRHGGENGQNNSSSE